MLLNVSFIGCSLFVAPHVDPPVLALAIAVVDRRRRAARVPDPGADRVGMLPRLRFDVRAALADPGVRRVLKKMVPATFAVSVAQISLIINTNIASRLGARAASRGSPTPTG